MAQLIPEWHGLFGGSKTPNGFDLDAAKSGLQKYIRRGMLDKALVCAFELYSFRHIPEAAAAVSNLYNRLAIIAAEDIGCADLGLVSYILNAVHDPRSTLSLVLFVHMMCEAPKTRTASHLWYVYATAQGQERAAQAGINIDYEYTQADIDAMQAPDATIFLDPDIAHQELVAYAIVFNNRLASKDPNAFRWAGLYLDFVETNKTKVAGRTKVAGVTGTTTNPMIILWHTLRKYMDAELWADLCTAYFTYSEKRPFLQLAIASVIQSDNVHYKPITQEYLNELVAVWSTEESMQFLTSLENNEFTIELDPYVMDKHTAKGKAAGADIKTFVEEGAHVENEDMTLAKPDIAELYRTRT